MRVLLQSWRILAAGARILALFVERSVFRMPSVVFLRHRRRLPREHQQQLFN
jgi:hypothetical protein